SDLERRSKIGRGLDHDGFGEYLCSAEHDWDDAETRKAIRDGEILLSADTFPKLCWHHNEIDNEDVLHGFLRTHEAVKCFRHVFTSPSSATIALPDNLLTHEPDTRPGKKVAGATRGSNASLIGLDRVTPRSLAYIFVMVRVALSDMPEYSNMDGEFD
ncbi:hypothetical protein DENSPDRAFT_764248, partial [Dentipellis sp. KUC8613]